MLIKSPPSWNIPEREVTPEAAWDDRRSFLKKLGFFGASALAIGTRTAFAEEGPIQGSYAYTLPKATPNARYAGLTPTEELHAASYNNFYEFSTDKAKVWKRAGTLLPKPWTVEVGGKCDQPGTFDIETLLQKMPLEERICRFRCVEAWSMVVPWIGFPFSALLDLVAPRSDAKFVRMVTLNDSKQMPGLVEQPWYPWPYFEGLSMAEARNPLAMLAVGIYGHPLPNQHGAPIRLVTPWKYGFKSIKSIVKIELTEKQPPTFWNRLAADEYSFEGNVDPAVPHPRWSQAMERVIPTGTRQKTLKYNGYGQEVAALYGG